MGCEQCKLSDLSEEDNSDNVIANVGVEQVTVAETAICTANEEGAEPPDIQCENYPNCNTAPIEGEMEGESSSVPNNDVRSLLDVQHTVDSNILDSTERLEAEDTVFELNNISDEIVDISSVAPEVEESEESEGDAVEPDNDRPTRSATRSNSEDSEVIME